MENGSSMVEIYNGYLLKFSKDENGLISVEILYCNYQTSPVTIKHYYQENNIIASEACEEIDPSDISEEIVEFLQQYSISIDEISAVESGVALVDNIMWTEF